MAIRVVATGSVVESPAQLMGEDVRVAFVLDPFPESRRARLARACEVLCRGQDLPSTAIRVVQRGDRVEVMGQLMMERVDGPLEDDLSAARVWIEASRISVLE
jgi:hypothetical protein